MAEQDAYRTALRVLRGTFGYERFRPGQDEAVRAALAGRDVLAIMPTGAGKSLCYQVPALVRSGLTLVVSPLVALMEDQVRALQQTGAPAAFLNARLAPFEREEVLRQAASGQLKLLYITPERLDDPAFASFAERADIALLAVDEAHCISQWGNDFRPSYLRIAAFASALPTRPPCMALTATATDRVRHDIISMLGLRQPHMVITGYDRPNLHLRVERLEASRKTARVIAFAQQRPAESGIVYCQTRAQVEDLHEALTAAGLPATRYHAGLAADERVRNQRAFIADDAPIMVATNAFGMGIDKSNVRYVVHFNMPASIEAYYQEAGRAGRDGEPAECLLLWNDADIAMARFLISGAAAEDADPDTAEDAAAARRHMLNAMCGYCLTARCLRQHILAYFGEAAPGACGSCSNCEGAADTVDVTAEARAVMRCVQAMRGRFGKGIISSVLRGKANQKVRDARLDELACFGTVDASDARIKDIVGLLAAEGYLRITEGRYPLVEFGPRYREAAEPDFSLAIKDVPKRSDRTRGGTDGAPRSARSGSDAASTARNGVGAVMPDALGPSHPPEETAPTPEQEALFERLRALRKRIADAAEVPPYIVFSDATLRDMCIRMPATEAELLEVKGVGAVKLERYGQEFLAAIQGARIR